MLAIFQALLVGLELVSKFFEMYQKRQLEKEAEARISAKVIRKVANVRKRVKDKLRARYPDFMD